MITIYKYDKDGFATGKTREQSERDPIPPGWTHKAPTGAAGERFAGNVWQIVPVPPDPVPDEVPMENVQQELLARGEIDDVEAAIDALPVAERRPIRISWERRTMVRRNDQLVARVIQNVLGYTEAQADQFFRDADARG